MIKTIKSLLEQYKKYSDPYGKIRREVKKGNLFPIVRGLYETDDNVSGVLLSSLIYGPSYVSFEYALSHHGMIPEKVEMYTNATYNKRRTKLYKTSFGNYSYQDIPKEAYPFEIEPIIYDDYVVFMARPEKALCDQLYKIRPASDITELHKIIFNDLRIDKNLFLSLDKKILLELIPKYKSTNLYMLEKIIVMGDYRDDY